jgi:hypothetical protein
VGWTNSCQIASLHLPPAFFETQILLLQGAPDPNAGISPSLAGQL